MLAIVIIVDLFEWFTGSWLAGNLSKQASEWLGEICWSVLSEDAIKSSLYVVLHAGVGVIETVSLTFEFLGMLWTYNHYFQVQWPIFLQR